MAAVCLVALGAGWFDGPLNALVLLVLLVVLGGVGVLAVFGGPEARRLLAPYGLMKPGLLWMALFFLAPVWSLVRISLSTKESRFSVQYNFTWAWDNYSR
ncbi:MAG: hypothetical protein ACO38L_05590, partial [Ilumatobacteraceae bacterium]